MKINFDENLAFQIDAINSIVDIFYGQPISSSNFTIENRLRQASMDMPEYDTGVSNRLVIDSEDILKNVQQIQLVNGLEQTKRIDINNMHFSIEMETGERVIIVMGAVFIIKSRVSGALNKYISCIA